MIECDKLSESFEGSNYPETTYDNPSVESCNFTNLKDISQKAGLNAGLRLTWELIEKFKREEGKNWENVFTSFLSDKVRNNIDDRFDMDCVMDDCDNTYKSLDSDQSSFKDSNGMRLVKNKVISKKKFGSLNDGRAIVRKPWYARKLCDYKEKAEHQRKVLAQKKQIDRFEWLKKQRYLFGNNDEFKNGNHSLVDRLSIVFDSELVNCLKEESFYDVSDSYVIDKFRRVIINSDYEENLLKAFQRKTNNNISPYNDISALSSKYKSVDSNRTFCLSVEKSSSYADSNFIESFRYLDDSFDKFLPDYHLKDHEEDYSNLCEYYRNNEGVDDIVYENGSEISEIILKNDKKIFDFWFYSKRLVEFFGSEIKNDFHYIKYIGNIYLRCLLSVCKSMQYGVSDKRKLLRDSLSESYDISKIHQSWLDHLDNLSYSCSVKREFLEILNLISRNPKNCILLKKYTGNGIDIKYEYSNNESEFNNKMIVNYEGWIKMKKLLVFILITSNNILMD